LARAFYQNAAQRFERGFIFVFNICGECDLLTVRVIMMSSTAARSIYLLRFILSSVTDTRMSLVIAIWR
jgi:hypothetical protein